MSFTDVLSNSYVGRGNKILFLLLYSPAFFFLKSMRGVPVTNHVNAVYLFLFLLLLEMTEIFFNTSKDDNSTVRPHDDNIECFNSNLNGP